MARLGKDPNDGPHDGTSPAGDIRYPDVSGPSYGYLGHFRGRKFVEEGHNTTDGAVSKKISHLIKSEGKPQKQAVAIALNMRRAGRLTKSGGYRRVGK